MDRECPEPEDHDCENDELPVNPEMVQDLRLQLDPYKSMEPYRIHPKTLKNGLMSLRNLSMIFEWSWESGEIPADWKLMNVVQIFKKGKKEDLGNYRPVSLTSVPVQALHQTSLNLRHEVNKYLPDSKLYEQTFASKTSPDIKWKMGTDHTTDWEEQLCRQWRDAEF